MNLLVPDWFVEQGDGLALKGWKCGDCGKSTFPRKYICPACGSAKLQECVLSKRGILHTFTESHLAGPEAPPTPFVIGFVDLPEGIKLISVITECQPWKERLSMDMEVEMVIGELRKDSSGNAIYSYLFRPVPFTEQRQ